MSHKIDVSEIIRAHYRTLYDNHFGRPSRVDLLVFFVLPLVVAVTATIAGARLGAAAGSLLGAVSILGGFLFALLVLVLQMSADAAARTEEENGPLLGF